MTIRLEPDRFGVRTKIDVHDRLLSITLHFRYRPTAVIAGFIGSTAGDRAQQALVQSDHCVLLGLSKWQTGAQNRTAMRRATTTRWAGALDTRRTQNDR